LTGRVDGDLSVVGVRRKFHRHAGLTLPAG
jgi:hypothetical protein